MRNTTAAAVQAVVVGLTTFVLYRFVRDAVGEAAFGVWALVLATTTVGNLANLGLAASAVKFVSQHLARGDGLHVDRIVQTAALSVALFLGVAAAAAYLPLRALLAVLIDDPGLLPVARVLLPYALGSFWLLSVGGVFLSCLDGLHRVDLRALLWSGGAVLYLLFAVWLVPGRGLVGLALAQLGQAATLWAGAWVLLRAQRPSLPLVPWHWSGQAFREMLGYSLSFQAVSFAQLLLEPTAKALVGRFGGLATLANFEFAYKMVFQLRSLLAAAHQAVVPAIAEAQERAPERLRRLYVQSFRLLAVLVLLSFPLLIALTPFISYVWIGQVEPEFVGFASLLFVAWGVNLFSNPAYFANLGIGTLGWNVAGHVVMGTVCAGLGFVLGRVAGGTGVVAAYALAIVAGSLTVAVSYQRRHRIRLADLVGAPTARLGVACLTAGGLAAAAHGVVGAAWSPWAWAGAVVGGYLLVVAWPAWRHPLRQVLQAWGRDLVAGREAASRK